MVRSMPSQSRLFRNIKGGGGGRVEGICWNNGLIEWVENSVGY